MADSGGDVAQRLASGVATPIAQLGPDLTDQSSRIVRGEVTIVWPYNSVNKSLAFLIAEPDVRLRRAKGLIRVQLNGASAAAVAACSLGGGDEVTLSLDGVGWEKDDAQARPAGSRSEWQMQFSNKIVLEAKLVETEETKVINVSHATPPEPVEITIEGSQQIQEPAIPEPTPQITAVPTPRRGVNGADTGEYPSPAFIKRARVSYGALLETDFDELEEDGGVKGKGRKKPRFSIGGARWRYQSTTPSPEPEIQESPSPEAEVADIKARDSTPPKPQMLDEGSQTVETELTPVPQMAATPGGHGVFGLEPSSPLERQAITNVFSPHTDIGVQTQHTSFSTRPTDNHQSLFQSAPKGVSFGENAPQAPQHTAIHASEDGYSVPRFQAAMPGPQFGGPELSLGDQVRFGFSHQPQSAFSQVREDVSDPERHAQRAPEAYPETFLEQYTSPARHPSDMHSNFEAGVHIPQDQYAVVEQPPEQGHQASRKPSGQHELLLWPIDAPSMDYEHAVAHIDVDAPLPAQEGHRTIKDDLRSNGSEPVEEPIVSNDDEVKEQEAEAALEQPIYRQGDVEDQGLAGPENDLEEQDEDISSEEEADYDEDQVGDDYDMRNYADVEDDEEGFESQEEDAPLPDGEIMDEDGEGSYDEDEEGSYDEEEDEEEEEEDAGMPQRAPLYYQPPSRGPPMQAKSSGPVVIDLISDSEDEEEIQPAAITPKDQYDGPADIEPPIKASALTLGDNIPISNRVFPSSSSHLGATAINAGLKEESPSYEVEPDSGSEEEEDSGEDGNISDQSEERSDFDDEAENEEEVEEEEVLTAEETNIVVEAEIIKPSSDRMLSGHEREAVEMTEELAGHTPRSTSPEHVPFSLPPMVPLEPVPQQPQDSSVEDHDIPIEDVVHNQSDTRAMETQPAELQDAAMADGSEMLQSALRVSEETSQMVTDFIRKIETSDEQQDDRRALPSSPPLTQQFESQTMPLENLLRTDLDSSQPTANDDGNHLLTPHDTQLPGRVSSQPPLDDETATSEVTQEVTEPAENISLQPAAELALELTQDSRQKTPTILFSHPVDTQVSPEIVADAAMSGRSPESVIADKLTVASSGDVQNQEPLHSSGNDEDQHEDNQEEHGLKPQESLVTAHSPVSEKAGDKDKDEPVDVVEVQAEDKTETDGPAAGTRRLRSRAPPPPPVDRSVQLARAAIASKRGKRANDQTPISPRTTRTRSMSFQKSTTPEAEDQSVQRARAALKSPSKRKGESLTEQLKSDLSKRLPVEMPDCIPLKLLWSHHNKNLDIAAVATTNSSNPQRAKGGPRQYIMSFNITDPTIAPSEVTEVHFFRAHKDFLPTIKPGDAVLLRNFTVTPLKDKGFGLRSDDDSSWAVFDKDNGLAQIRGPPIELNDEEIDYMMTIKKWYAALDKPSQAEVEKANQKFAEVNRAK